MGLNTRTTVGVQILNDLLYSPSIPQVDKTRYTQQQ